jgi:hypothetical protein
MLVLSLVQVRPEAIVDDYIAGEKRLPALFASRGEPDQGPSIAAYLQSLGITPHQAVLAALDAFDAQAHARRAGVTAEQLKRLRCRLLHPARPTPL